MGNPGVVLAFKQVKMQKTSVSMLDLNVEKKMEMLLKHWGGRRYILLLLIIFSRSVVGINATGLMRKSPVSWCRKTDLMFQKMQHLLAPCGLHLWESLL